MMRKFLFFGACVSLAIACSKENSLSNPSDTSQDSDNIFYVEAQATSDIVSDKTKVTYIDREGAKWLSTEKINLVGADCTQKVQSTTTTVSSDGYTATFAFSNLAAGVYRPYYKVDVEYSDNSWRHYWAEVKKEQSQQKSGTLDAGVLPLIGNSDLNYDGSSSVSQATFKVLGSLIRYFVFGGKPGESVIDVKMQITSPDGGPSGWIHSNDEVQAWGGDKNSYVNVHLATPAQADVANKDAASGIYAHIIPCHGTFTYTIISNQTVHTFESTVQKNYENSKLYNMYLNLASAKATHIDYVTIAGAKWTKNVVSLKRNEIAQKIQKGFLIPSWDDLNSLLSKSIKYYGNYAGQNGVLLSGTEINGLTAAEVVNGEVKNHGDYALNNFTESHLSSSIFLPVNVGEDGYYLGDGNGGNNLIYFSPAYFKLDWKGNDDKWFNDQTVGLFGILR